MVFSGPLTLDELVTRFKRSGYPVNGYVREPGWEFLYMRVTFRVFEGVRYPTIDLANISARVPGMGTFTKLIKKLRANYPEFVIMVENVVSDRFSNHLATSPGWKVSNYVGLPSYYLKGSDCG